jgi:hypothetical protein
MWLQTIIELIQRMAPEGSPLLALAQQEADAANHVIAGERSTGNHRGEPSIGNRSDRRAKRAQSEAASLTSDNHRLADNDVCQRITQNRWQWECGRDHDDVHNVIDDWRHLRARSPTSPRCSPRRDATPSGRVISGLWLHRSGKSSGQKSSRLGTLTNMTAPVT